MPTLYRHIIQRTAYGRADVPTLRHCMSAGEQLSGELLAAWRERFGLDIYEGLGMTECSYYLCETKGRPIRPGSAGFAQPGHDVKLLDPHTWQRCRAAEEGMICIPRTDPALLLRYWNQPEETAACFRGDWFLTGDYARRDADGYIWFLGRKDDLINSFGYRVSPHEVERVLKDHPDVADVAAVGEELANGQGAGRGVRDPAARRRAHRRRRHRVWPSAPRGVQGAEDRLSGRRVPAHPQRQDSAARALAAPERTRDRAAVTRTSCSR